MSTLTMSKTVQSTPPADSNNVSNDSPTSVSSPVLFDWADVGSTTEEDASPAGFSGGDNDISDSFSLDSPTLIKVVLIKNLMLKEVMLILSKVQEILNKVVMWNIVGVMLWKV